MALLRFLARTLACWLLDHQWEPISSLRLCGRVKSRCRRCRRVAFVHYVDRLL